MPRWLALCALLLPPLAAHAECETAPGCAQEAAAAHRAGRLEQALRLFEHAQSLAPDPTLLWNIAVLQQDLGRDAEAATTLARFLDAHPQDDRAALARRKREMLAARGQVEVRVESATADVRVHLADPQKRHSGTAPFAAKLDARGPIAVRCDPPAAPIVAEPPPSVDLTRPAYIALGIGGAAAVAAGVFTWLAVDAQDEADALRARARREGAETAVRVGQVNGHEADADQYRTLAVITGGLAIAGLATGGTLLAVDRIELPARGQLQVGPAGANALWRF